MANKSGKESFVVYETFYDSLKLLPDDIRVRVYDLMMLYGLYGIVPENAGDVERALLSPIAFGIDQAKKNRIHNQTCGSLAGNRVGNKNAFKEKKCTACKFYRKCEDRMPADKCEYYTPKYDKNENEPKRAETSENDLNVNVNEFKALSLNVPRLNVSNESEINPFPEEPKVNEEVSLNSSQVVQLHHAERSSATESEEEVIEDIHYSDDFVPLPKPKETEELYVDKIELENSLSFLEEKFKQPQSLDEAAEIGWSLVS